MTIAGRREPRFSDITKVRGLGTKFYAMSGKRQTVIIAQNNNGLAEVVSETPNLGSEARDVVSDPAVPNTLYILTDDGVQVVDASPAVPVLGPKSNFDPGDGRWILATSVGATKYIVAPVDGGIAIRDAYGAEGSTSRPPGIGGCRDAAIGSDDVLYGVDQQRAKIHVWRITLGKAKYISSFAAKNCRDVVKVVLDPVANILFVQCKHRIVGFNVSPAGTADEAISVTLRQDYGVLKAEYTNMAQIGPDKYWIGVDADSALNPAPEFYGRPYGAWDAANSLLFTAFPAMSWFAASNVVPYVGEAQLPDIPVIVVPPPIPVLPPPPVVTPLPPVITSSLTASATEDLVFNYTITATGTGPITYGVMSPPSWLTSVNATTGGISGTPPDPGTFNLLLTASNAGGSDTETLVVTVTQDSGWMGGMAGLYDATTTIPGTLKFRHHKAAVGSDTLEVYKYSGFGPDVNFRCRLIAPDASVVTTTGNGLVSFNITQAGVYDVYIMERPPLYEDAFLSSVGTSVFRYRINTGPLIETSRGANGAVYNSTLTKTIGTGAGNTFTEVFNFVTEAQSEISTAMTHATFGATGAPFSGPVTNVATLQAQVGPGYFDGSAGSIIVTWTGIKMGGVDMIGAGSSAQCFVDRVAP